MGFLDNGETRPGQLGDTGIIVLEHCGPLLKVWLKGSALRFIRDPSGAVRRPF
jgi:hypothetical protein